MHQLRVYIAGSSAPTEIDRVCAWSDRLTSSGIKVVSTWPGVIRSVGSGNPREATSEQRRIWSAQDLNEVASADVLWLLYPPVGLVSFGAGVELGCAYTRAMPILCSGDTRQSIFSALGEEFAADEEAYSALLLMAAGRAER